MVRPAFAMNRQSEWRADLARQVSPIYAADSRVRAVMIAGSVGRGVADEDSDVDQDAVLAALAERNDPERTLVALTMLSTLLTNAKRDAAKYGSIKSSSKALGSKVLECEGGVAALE